jgi:hypothetical protein
MGIVESEPGVNRIMLIRYECFFVNQSMDAKKNPAMMYWDLNL